MKSFITRTRVAVVAAFVIALVPATALASHVFDDVPDDEFYAEAVEWAAATDLTTGVAPGQFAPDRELTRGEAVTFLYRFNNEIVEPAIGMPQGDAGSMFDVDQGFGDAIYSSTDPADVGLSATVTIPAGRTGIIVATFSAESSCYGGDGESDWCEIDIVRSASTSFPVNLGVGDFAFDSTDNGTETVESWEGHSAVRVSEELPAGTYDIAVWASVSDDDDGDPLEFRLDERVLTAEVKLTG